MKEWRYHFSLAQIERGYDLYYHGTVSNLMWNHHQIQANVQNNQVKIVIDNDVVQKINCTCHQENCVHGVATLIAYEQKEHLYEYHFFNSKELIDRLSSQQKDELLLNLFEKDGDLKKEANRLLGNELSLTDQKQFELHQILFQYNKDGIIFPLQLYVHSFLEREKTQEDYEIYCLLLNRLKMLEKDQSVQLMIYQLLDQLKDYLKQFPIHQNSFFEFLMRDHENEMYLDFLFDYFRFEPFLTIKLGLINQYIHRIDAYNAWGKNYYLERYHLKKLQVLYDLKKEKEMQQILESYYAYPKIREFFIVLALNQKDEMTALKLINDSKRMDKNNRYLMIQYQNYLIDLYENKNAKAYKDALREQLFLYDVGAYDIYLKYKLTCTKKEWEKEYLILINQPMEEDRLLDLLLNENDEKRLFYRLSKTNNFYYIEKKKKILQERFPNAYANLINNETI